MTFSSTVAEPLTLKTSAQLSFREELYVKLTTAGQESKSIMKLMKIDQEKIYNLRFSIKNKLSANTWQEVIARCFENHYLSSTDYVYDEIRFLALNYSENLSKNSDPSFLQWSQWDKVDALIRFYTECHEFLRTHFANQGIGKNLTATEIDYLKDQFKGNANGYYSAFMSEKQTQKKSLRKRLFQKLGAKHWFECFRKAIILDIIKLGDVLTISPYTVATKIIQELKSNLDYVPLPKRALQLEIYESLLKFYCTLTYSCVFQSSKTSA